uniref:Major capsid protein N-terminal domain-containing protein n=1 Tax=viral metagenome TaxID=1070528 RepID=A0A6C0H9S8_9ZZZZ
MSGGLIQLVSASNQDIVLTGNPSKTFFKSTYHKYTNFSLQKFRLDFEGARTLRLSEESNFTFKVKRYADLLMDCYLSVDLPNIWSPIFPPNTDTASTENNTGAWIPYEFKWIENIGAQMISRITITCGNQTLQEYSGAYILAMAQRDFSTEKKALFDKMIGNVPELNNPGNSGSRVNSYPNAYYTTNPAGAEPSIRGRTLYIPLNSWFTMKSQMAFPLVALQYNELHINVTMRPIQELFQIRDVMDSVNNYPYVAPNFNLYYMQFYRFLQTPPDISLGVSSYTDTRTLWNADVHLNCTYCFLSNAESRIFALNEQKYLFRQVRENVFYNVTGPNKVQLDSIGMISNYTFYMQRSDANLRNEWSNYTNWPYNYLPYDLTPATTNGDYKITRTNPDGSTNVVYIGPGVNSDGKLTGWMLTGNYNLENEKNILVSMALLLDGSYRENAQPVGVYNYVEKYTRTAGNAPDGLYVYNFCMNTSPFDLQPSGAINMSRFTTIEFEINTIVPSLDPYAQSLTICDPESGQIIGINKPTWRIYNYNFNLVVFEERINMVTFVGGNCGLMYAT